MSSTIRSYFLFAALYTILAIGLGAFGAHTLRDYMTDLGTYDTASSYHFYACFLLFAFALVEQTTSASMKWAYRLMAIGSILFSGTVYGLAFRDDLPQSIISILGPLTPIGGTVMIISLVAFAQAIRKK